VENSRASNLPLPKYHRVYLVLRQQLDEGRFAAGVPGELALMESFGVSRGTVRRALERAELVVVQEAFATTATACFLISAGLCSWLFLWRGFRLFSGTWTAAT
jgi:hypothetical protein